VAISAALPIDAAHHASHSLITKPDFVDQ